jgi:hypothetical protein
VSPREACRRPSAPCLLRVLTPVGLAPPERPGGKLLWNLGTSPLRLRPPALAGAGPAHSGGAQRGPERERAAGEARGRRGRARATPLGPAVQGKWRSSGVALTFGLHCHLHTVCTYTSPALPGLPGLSGVWGSLRGRLEESSRLGRLERVVRPAWESQLPFGYSQLPTAFSQPTAASTAGSLQLQARSPDTPGVEGDGATFVGKKSFEATSGNRTGDPATQSFRLTTQHACTPGRKYHPSCLLTYRPQARPSVSGEPT